MSDMKVKIPDTDIFYYPDVFVACDPGDNAQYFRARPTVIFEVLSRQTERTDQYEKRLAYGLIPSLRVYLLVAQDKPELTVFRRTRTERWSAEVVAGPKAILKLPEIKINIALSRIYERTGIGRLSLGQSSYPVSKPRKRTPAPTVEGRGTE